MNETEFTFDEVDVCVHPLLDECNHLREIHPDHVVLLAVLQTFAVGAQQDGDARLFEFAAGYLSWAAEKVKAANMPPSLLH